ncbi:MAG: hypothetical protein K6F32_01840 [Bacilli bacterium]|nr:hypothetical protein [Bacilli bacterium]
MNKRLNAITTLAIDILIVVFVTMSTVVLYFGSDGVLAAGGPALFKFFTTDSNVLLGICALINIPLDAMVLLGKRERISKIYNIIFHVGNVSTSVTLLTVIFFLGPTMGYQAMYVGMVLFMHLINPLLGLVRYIVFGGHIEEFSWQQSFFGIIPMFVYGIFYVINVVVHNGYGVYDYDWYGFGAGGPVGAAISFIVMLLATAAICIGIYFARVGVSKLLKKSENE